ncbi:MAG TPA: hypothetical protein VGA33_12095 [Thermoanaerobaculia bacterium]
MRHRSPGDRRCTYVVLLRRENPSDDLAELASYLSLLSISDFEIVTVDLSDGSMLEENRRVLRWLGRYVAARPQYIDPIRAAIDLAACDKVIVADAHIRYSDEGIDRLCTLLNLHEVVEPQDYLDPLPWWGGIETGRMLLHRGIGPLPDRGSTFGFRKRALSSLRNLHAVGTNDRVRRLAAQGAEVFCAFDIFVRRIPTTLDEWLRDRTRDADEDLEAPAKAALFFALLPIALVLDLLGGIGLASSYLGAVAFIAMALALRGRIGAAQFFPMRTCLFAPLWLFERSISVYWMMLRKLTGAAEQQRVPVVVRTRGQGATNGNQTTASTR